MSEVPEATGSARRFVLDSSAIIALLEGEAGADRVEEVLRNESTILPWVVLMEIHYVTLRESGKSEADRRHALLKALPSEKRWDTDEATVLAAAALKAKFRLSFADALIAAIAGECEATLLHKDPELEALLGIVDVESLPYKPTTKPTPA